MDGRREITSEVAGELIHLNLERRHLVGGGDRFPRRTGSSFSVPVVKIGEVDKHGASSALVSLVDSSEPVAIERISRGVVRAPPVLLGGPQSGRSCTPETDSGDRYSRVRYTRHSEW